MADEEEKPEEYKLVFTIPPNIVARFASNFGAIRTGTEIRLFFFDVQRPPTFSPEHEREKIAEAICVGSIITTIDRLPSFVGVLQGQLDGIKREVEAATKTQS